MNVVAGILAKKAFGRLKDKDIQTNSENPYTEKIPVHNARGEIIKYKEKERPVPDGLSTNDQNILKKVRRKAYKWDMSFRFCCLKTRFGWSFLIGLIPFLGDVADLLVALYIVKAASKVDGGLPKTLYARMMWNISLDFGIGLIPIVGDLADALFRANTRNAWLLDAYLTEKAKALQTGGVEDPDSGKTVAVPGELRAAGGPRRTDLEMGTGQTRMDTQRGKSTRK